MAEKELYTALGVDKKASQDEIKKAFRRLAKKYHPDKHKGDKAAEERFKEISSAYDVLGDPEKRKKYDQMQEARAYGFRGFSGGPFGRGGAGASNFEDVFGGEAGRRGAWTDFMSDLFGSRFEAKRAPAKGKDILYAVDIPWGLAVKGGKTGLTFPRTEECGGCGGTGMGPGASSTPCRTCHGTGSVQENQGAFSFMRVCPGCLGRGKVIDHPCSACRGAGEATRKRRVEIKIPKGVGDGQKIRIAGMGERGEGGGPPGDLYIIVQVATPTGLLRDGLDITSEVTIPVTAAILGAKRDVETAHGTVTVTIPPGAQPGSKLRLRGKGLSNSKDKKGDHFVKVNVRIPAKLTEEQKKLLAELEGTGM